MATRRVHRSTEQPKAASAGDQSNVALELPRRASHVELVGPVQDTPSTERKWLISRGGSEYLRATELLYHVLLYADGVTPLDSIAARISMKTGRQMATDEIRWLVLNKLAGSGLIDWPEGQSRRTDRIPKAKSVTPGASASMLSIKHRPPLFPSWLTEPAAAVMARLAAARLGAPAVAAVPPIAMPPAPVSSGRYQAPIAIGLAPRPLPTPLNSLGQPVAKSGGAALDEVGRRTEAGPTPAAEERAEDATRTYEPRPEVRSSEAEPAVARADAIAEEHDRIAGGFNEMRATLSRLAIELRRRGMIGAAEMADAAAGAMERPKDTLRGRR